MEPSVTVRISVRELEKAVFDLFDKKFPPRYNTGYIDYDGHWYSFDYEQDKFVKREEATLEDVARDIYRNSIVALFKDE